ncbi:hypothetical protein ACB092_04G078000 [Castanea dentata]
MRQLRLSNIFVISTLMILRNLLKIYWVDGLNTCIRFICHKSWLGWWLMPQKKSSFALQLPKRWWRSGRVEEEIEVLQHKLKHIEEGIAFSGRRAETARSQGEKVQITVVQEMSKILGNLAWAYLQQNNYSSVKEHY